MDCNQKSKLMTKIDRKASTMRALGKDDGSETLDGSDSLVTAHLDKTLFAGKKDNHLGTSHGCAIDKRFCATIHAKPKISTCKVDVTMECLSNIFLTN